MTCLFTACSSRIFSTFTAEVELSYGKTTPVAQQKDVIRRNPRVENTRGEDGCAGWKKRKQRKMRRVEG